MFPDSSIDFRSFHFITDPQLYLDVSGGIPKLIW